MTDDRVFRALADPTRLRILQRLAQGEGTVTDLMRHVDLSQPLVSAGGLGPANVVLRPGDDYS